jgi:hypothetical protein
MENSEQGSKRPVAITVICILGFIGAAISVPLVFSSMAASIGSWYPPYLGFSALAGTVCLIGLWMMKKWAAYAYTGLVALNQVVMVVMGVWTLFSLLIPLVVVIIALKYSPRMS